MFDPDDPPFVEPRFQCADHGYRADDYPCPSCTFICLHGRAEHETCHECQVMAHAELDRMLTGLLARVK